MMDIMLRFLAGVFLLVVFISCEQEEVTFADTIEVELTEENARLRKFKMTIDSVLQADYPTDFDFYADHWKGSPALDTAGQKVDVNGMGYLGEFDYHPLPASGKLFKVELNDQLESPHPDDPGEAEYVIVFELSPLINGGGFYTLVFEADGFGNNFIDAGYFSAEMVDSVCFIQMYDYWYMEDVQVYYANSASVYDNRGMVQYRLIDTRLSVVFESMTYEWDHLTYLDDEDTNNNANFIEYETKLAFVDTDGDGSREIVREAMKSEIISPKRDVGFMEGSRSAARVELLSTTKEVMHWSPMWSNYGTDQPINVTTAW